jgi:hypothetical protein
MFISSLLVTILFFLFIIYYIKKIHFGSEDEFVKTKEPETELDYKPIRKKIVKKKNK